MTGCGRLSDRIPAVVSGAAEWLPGELQHLAECKECQSEWDLVSASRRLGQRIGEDIDTETLAGRVLRGINNNRQADGFRKRRWTLGTLAAAAAVVLAVWLGGPNGPRGLAPLGNLAPTVETAIELPELDSLAPAELDSVLQGMDDPADTGSATDEVDLGDLNADELQRVLDTWEG
jgi:hypothetical protein